MKNPSELEHQRAIFERASIGVVEASLDGIIQYANPHAMHLLGVSEYQGLRLDAFYEDRNLLEEQLASRKAGLIGSYRARIIRQTDDVRLTVQVTAVPLTDKDGETLGSFALMRLPLEEEINRIHQEVFDADSVLFRVMQELRKVIPFDLATATRYSDDLTHAQPFFLYRPDSPKAKVEWRKQWQPIPPGLRSQVAETETRLFTDLSSRLTDPALGDLKNSRLVRDLIEEKVQVCIRRPIRRRTTLLAAVTFFSRALDGLTEEHRRRIDELPIAASVIQAIEFFDRRREMERYKLLREVAYCATIEKVYETLVRRLSEIFSWTNVAIYRVDHARSKIRLVAASQSDSHRGARLDYEQDLHRGILGRVVRTGAPQVIPDVTTDPDYVANDAGPPMHSELCWPISLEGENAKFKVRWIVDVEDPRVDAFSEEQRKWLGETASEVGGVMQRLSTLNFLSECLESTSEPIVVVDAQNHIKRANPAAAELFEMPTPKDLQGELQTVFVAPEEMQRALSLPHGHLGEFSVRRIASASVLQTDVSRRPLPEDIGGAIYAFKDLRPVRRALELELLEQTTYEIALETRTPLMFAVSTLERSMRTGEPMSEESIEKVLKYLYRTKHAYTKLAMFNPSVRGSPRSSRPIDVAAEIRAIQKSLPDEMRQLVHLKGAAEPARIVGDCFQISFVFETVLMFFVRTSPEEVPIVVTVSRGHGRITVDIEGFLPQDYPMAGDAAQSERMQSELRLAYPLIMDFLAKNGGTYSQERLTDDRVRYRVWFSSAG